MQMGFLECVTVSKTSLIYQLSVIFNGYFKNYKVIEEISLIVIQHITQLQIPVCEHEQKIKRSD